MTEHPREQAIQVREAVARAAANVCSAYEQYEAYPTRDGWVGLQIRALPGLGVSQRQHAEFEVARYCWSADPIYPDVVYAFEEFREYVKDKYS